VTTTKYSISATSRITGKGRATISRHMKAGKLSFEIDTNGNRVVDAAELLRVYGDSCEFDREQGKPHTSTTTRSETSEGSHLFDVKELQRQLEQQYQAQINVLTDALERSQEGHNRATLLLEQKSSQSDGWKDAIASMEQRLANESETQKKQMGELKKALIRERNKSVWQKLFG